MEDRDHADTLTLTEDETVRYLVSELRWERERVTTLLDQLSLAPSERPDAEFLDQGPAVRPWRFGRERSYLRRPMVVQRQRAHRTYTFGRRALWQAPRYWLQQFASGRLQAKTKPMASMLSRLRKEKGEAFERLVAEHLQMIGYAPVRLRFRRVGRFDFRNINGENLGDIDIVAVDITRRELLLLEVKDLEAARTPVELAREVENLVGKGNSAVRRLAQRVRWINQHLLLTLDTLGVQAVGRWTIRPIVVVNEPLLSEQLLIADIPILSLERLSHHLKPSSAVKGRPKRQREPRRGRQ